jgi:signal transduction histidine kinase
MSALLSTVQRLPDGARAEVERALLPLARDAALGALAADVAHDVGNALFGLIGLVDLSLDGTPIDPERAALITKAEADVKRAFQPLLDFSRGASDTARGDLSDAARAALALYRHGGRKQRELVAGLDGAAPVACGRGRVVEAAVHLLLATDESAPLHVEVAGGALRVAPAAEESLHSVAARRIAVDCGGALEREGDAFVLRLPA